MFKLGPKITRGEIWDLKGHSKIVEILITHQRYSIKSIRFSYRDANNRVVHSPTYGDPCGLNFNIVEFNTDGEDLTSVSGKYLFGELASIVFGTNKRKFGPFGSTDSSSGYQDFNYEFKAGRFGGFHGSVSDGCVNAIGVYVKPYAHQPKREPESP
ncbi:hypothetical protein SSX86_003283 [Deinandra increscens subsp. villosa]|uniref:Jacalin-type lectin domain-containing protein n=1 Tax=Deinandra increscens subsp. villosa TaxID=3103831 RepID=A0AAP0DPP9_9ASTR